MTMEAMTLSSGFVVEKLGISQSCRSGFVIFFCMRLPIISAILPKSADMMSPNALTSSLYGEN